MGMVYKRPPKYHQNVGASVEIDEYTAHAYQYATSTKAGFCQPAVIIHAANETDIKLAVKYARDAGIAIAIRTGGHQFMGFSSTSGKNIQIDMSSFTFCQYDEQAETIKLGVGVKLDDLDYRLAEIGAFAPHGQCGAVCLGGHMQTGGFYVFCGRSFGMFCDYITEFRIITAEAKTRTIKKPSVDEPDKENDDLWYAVIGGSPGNFGVVTEMTMKLLFDRDYPESRSRTIYMPYSPEALEEFLNVVAKYNDMYDLPADFNICSS
jgi:FAD/FMN-containing dehydrogenase